MIRPTVLLLLALTPAMAQITKTAATRPGGPTVASIKALKIAPGTFTTIEKHFDQQLSNLFDLNDPLDLLGFTRGVYLDGYGVVFTTELSLVITPRPNPFMQTISKEMADKVRRRKVERLPFLKAIMKEMMRSAAMTFIQIPNDQQVVVAVRFLYEPWEDRNGMPSQILMRADRKSAIAGEIQVEEQ